MERTCLVTGGSGFVGGRLIELLRQDGWRVRAIGRSPEALRRVESLGAVPVPADLEDQTALSQALQDCTTVFHAAALFKLWGSEDEFNRANVEGTRRLLTVARSMGVRSFVQVGAAAVVMGEPVPMLAISEDAPLQIRSWAPYSSSKAKAERLVREANVPGSFHTAVIRPPFIWGQGMPMLDQMIRSIETRQFRWPGDGEQAMSTCHVDNVCRAAILAAERGTGGASYFVSDGADGTLRTVITALLATRNIVPPKASVPFGLAWWMARCMEAVWRVFHIGGEPPMTRQMLRMIGMPFTLNIARARRELGYQPIVSWQSGIGAMSPRISNPPTGVLAAID
jgi:nucleoside-diphosphate-sugar epimerase